MIHATVLENSIDSRVIEVNEDICVGDEMYTTREHYFQVGRSALRCVTVAMIAAGKQTVGRILDLPCGHGRVLRTLKAAFPDAELTACDIAHDGVDFCARTLGARPVYGTASEPPKLDREFDLIWCGSLLTHLDAPRWPEFLKLFDAALSRDGVFVFTTHGTRVIERIGTEGETYGLDRTGLESVVEGFNTTGFGYHDYPNSQSYGISVASTAWVCQQLSQFRRLRLLTYTEAGWDHHQDVVACTRATD
jgi:SAM-dependent methyltransferase